LESLEGQSGKNVSFSKELTMSRMMVLVVLGALVAACGGETLPYDAGVDGGMDGSATDTDTDADSDGDTDGDADGDGDTDSDADTDTNADCPYDCIWMIETCYGTAHDEYACGWGQYCCEQGDPPDSGPEPDAGPACPWSCASMLDCGGIGHSGYDCGFGEVCCEPVDEPDGGFGTCDDAGFECLEVWEVAMGDCNDGVFHFELACGSDWQTCCEHDPPADGGI
jgi:hypothetical protein